MFERVPYDKWTVGSSVTFTGTMASYPSTFRRGRLSTSRFKVLVDEDGIQIGVADVTLYGRNEFDYLEYVRDDSGAIVSYKAYKGDSVTETDYIPSDSHFSTVVFDDTENYYRCASNRVSGMTTEVGTLCFCCYPKGTQITLADGSTKNVEDITFDDELLVWNFDEGHLDKSNPIWIQEAKFADEYNRITFANGNVLETINQHRIFNKEAGKFTYPMTEDTPIGTTTLLDDGTETTVVSKEVIHEPVEYYNIITRNHLNCFVSGVLTSCRLNNMYPIKDYKFEKDDRELVAYENFHDIPMEWYEGLRLAEQPQDINRENAVVFDKSLNDYVTRLIRTNNESKRLALV